MQEDGNDEEFDKEARVRSDEENNAPKRKSRRVNPPPTRPIYDARGGLKLRSTSCTTVIHISRKFSWSLQY